MSDLARELEQEVIEKARALRDLFLVKSSDIVPKRIKARQELFIAVNELDEQTEPS